MLRENRSHSTYITSACRAIAQVDCTHRGIQVVNMVDQELAVKCELSKGPPIPRYKYEPKSVLQNSNFNLYYDMSVVTDPTVLNNRPAIVIFDSQQRKILNRCSSSQ